jgi:MFS transporter, NNP family, nitrate/nitrite transporter
MPRRQLAFGTISFAVCFAAWGLISAFAPRFREMYHLSASQTALLVAVPVLLGSLARLPMGLLTDRFQGRIIFSTLMLASAIPAVAVPMVHSYSSLVAVAFFLGMAGSSFAVGVGFVSPWFAKEKQGSALGVYGLGNAGQSAAVFLGPVLASRVGWQNVFRTTAVLLVVWAIVFAAGARNATVTVQRKSFGQMIGVLRREPLAWTLSAFYFLSFGGFVAFSIYLPSLLKDEFKLAPADAGLRTAGFVILATLLRPVGGWLADKIGGARVLSIVFFGVVPFALLLGWPSMLPFTVGALGCAAMLGLANGAVFKLVPHFFPTETGTVTGLVGAMGGLGGFFPPLLLGIFKDRLGAIWPGFVLLAAVAFTLWIVNGRVFLKREATLPRTRLFEQLRAGAWATLWTALLVAAIVVGSRNLENFDPALVIYTFAVIFATWGVVYHYNVWIEKPPTRLYWDRGWELVRKRGIVRSLFSITRVAATHLVEQRFVKRRSALRWWMHQCLFWGC